MLAHYRVILWFGLCLPLAATARDGKYQSADGQMVEIPTQSPDAKYGAATAMCRDESISYSHHRRGTCNFHGGVAEWLREVP